MSEERKVLDRETLISLLGEGFHTAFRKASDGPGVWEIWKLIWDLDSDDWSAVLAFVADGFTWGKDGQDTYQVVIENKGGTDGQGYR